VIGLQDPSNNAAEKLVQLLMRTNKEFYEKLVDLIRYLTLQDIDLRQVSQLKSCFIGKDHQPLAQVPINVLKEAIKQSCKHLRQVDEICGRICACIEKELEFEGARQLVADASKLHALIEVMKCGSAAAKRDKNNSAGMSFVMQPSVEAQVSVLLPSRLNQCN